MTSKERVLCSLNWQEPDRVPVQIYLTPEFRAKLEAHFQGRDVAECLGIDFRGVDLTGVCFDGCDLRHAKLADCNLSRATFRGANLKAASLWNSDCKDACFDGAILEEADMDFSNLDGCTFKDAKIRKAIFPYNRLPLEELLHSVRTGRRVRMDARGFDD